MRLPSRSVKLRTQPTWSLRSCASMRLASTTSCHSAWLLKSRSTAHTRSMGASMMVERTTRWSISAARAKVAFERVESALEHTAADQLGQLALPAFVAFELCAPFGEAARAIGHRRELERGDVVRHAHRAFEDLVGAAVFIV